ncbi:hypothetical protein Ddye_017738, partial [Dipteronia dyeriana]
MVERKLFKTKLCVPYQKGRCSCQTCSFAHGDSELRRSFGSYITLTSHCILYYSDRKCRKKQHVDGQS